VGLGSARRQWEGVSRDAASVYAERGPHPADGGGAAADGVKPARDYCMKLASKPIYYFTVMTEIGLEQERSHEQAHHGGSGSNGAACDALASSLLDNLQITRYSQAHGNL
jgi:hypothetical protein